MGREIVFRCEEWVSDRKGSVTEHIIVVGKLFTVETTDDKKISLSGEGSWIGFSITSVRMDALFSSSSNTPPDDGCCV